MKLTSSKAYRTKIAFGVAMLLLTGYSFYISGQTAIGFFTALWIFYTLFIVFQFFFVYIELSEHLQIELFHYGNKIDHGQIVKIGNLSFLFGLRYSTWYIQYLNPVGKKKFYLFYLNDGTEEDFREALMEGNFPER